MFKNFAVAALVGVFVLAGPASAQTAGSLLFPDSTDPTLLSWGTDTVNAFLAVHQIPSSEWTVIRQYGRHDVYDNLRAFAWVRLQGMITGPSQSLTTEEQYVLNLFAADAAVLKVSALQNAVNEKNRYLSNRCTWQPDQTIATQAGYTYNGAYYCPTQPWSPAGFEGPPAISPPKEFFLAYGQKTGWIDPIAARPGGVTSIPRITLGGGLVLAIGFAAALAVARLFHWLVMLVGVNDFLGWNFIVSGSIALALALIMIVVVIYFYTENSFVEAQYPQLDQALASAQATAQFNQASLAATMKTQSGQQLLYATFLKEFIPTSNMASAAALPTPNPFTDPQFVVGSSLAPSISFKGWQGETYTLQMWHGWLESTANKTVSGVDSPSINTRFRYLWNGVPYEAARSGGLFIASKVHPASTDVACPPIPATGVSSATDLSTCKSFTTASLPMDLASGRQNVSIYQAPVLNPATDYLAAAWTDGFSRGERRQITITASGVPLPAITIAGGSLPPGFAYAAINAGSGTLSWDGTGATGTYSIPFNASNGIGTASATMQASVFDKVKFVQPGLTSNVSLTLTAGTRYSIPLVAVGSPTPTLKAYALDSCGLSLPNGDVTSSFTMSGIIAPPALGVKCVINVEATNSNKYTNPGCGCGSDTATIEITVTQPASQPALVTTTADAPVLRTSQTTVYTTGATGVVRISLTQGSNGPLAPSWITLDDRGDGTATLTMTPPANAPDTVLVPLWYRVANTAGNQATSATDGVLVNVVKAPVFQYQPDGGYLFVFSTAGGSPRAQIAVSNYGGSMTTDDPLPPGLSYTYDSTSGILNLFGTPLHAGDFHTTLRATNGYGTGSAPLHIVSVQPAQITSAARVNFYFGQANSFRLTATGFPQTPLPAVPAGLADALRFFSYTLPDPGIQIQSSDPSTGAPYYGYALLTGTPTLTYGVRPAIVYALTGNNQASVAAQNFQLVTTYPGDVNGDGVVDCSDIRFITSRYNQYAGMANYDYNADYNHDGLINAKDTALVLPYLAKGTRCQ